MVAARKLDPTIYPETDHMGEGELQQLIDESLRPLLARFLASKGLVAHVGSNTFIYYRQYDSSKRIAPDIYVLSGVPQANIARSWKLWEIGAPPSVALEVVSLDVDKDYIEAPEIHERIGTKELIVFDPEHRTAKDRRLWQVFRRTRGGELRLALATDADRVRCREIGAFLRAVGSDDTLRVRVATGARGDVLFPTEAEAERAEKERECAEKERECAEKERERAEKERERAEKERERAEKEREHAARLALQAENEALRSELTRLRGRRPSR